MLSAFLLSFGRGQGCVVRDVTKCGEAWDVDEGYQSFLYMCDHSFKTMYFTVIFNV